jgi:hypothetical protein
MGFKRPRLIYYLDYDKEEVKKMLTKEYGWQWYGGHHHENRYTIFHHWYNWKKFGIDQRLVEASAMIRSGTMTKEQAQEYVDKPYEIDVKILREIRRRFGLTKKDFYDIMHAPHKSCKDYKTYHKLFKLFKPFFWLMYKINRVPKSFYVKYCK